MSFEPPITISDVASPLDVHRPADGRFIFEPPPRPAAAPPPPPPALARPSNVTEAEGQIAKMINDPAFRTRLLNGDHAARSEFFAAHEVHDSGAGKVDQLLAGEKALPIFETVAPGQLPMRAQVAVVDDMRSLGIPDAAIKEAFEGTPAARGEVAAVKVWLDAAMSDQDFVERWLRGDRDAHRKVTLANIVITNGSAGAGRRF